jgi:lipopolysaccharide/colanic/teichoic acid biosynthesis glycosyltransferase
VKPGITGLAQIRGRNAISWEKKFYFDLFYVKNIDFTLDLRIIFLTFINIIKQKDINPVDKLTMDEFLGNKIKN